MCKLCCFPPKPDDYADLCERARVTLSLLLSVPDLQNAPTDGALQAIVELDEHRWVSGAEWGHPAYAARVRDLVFLNDTFEKGLKRFFGACLMDMKMPFKHTWSVGLLRLDGWLEGKNAIPGHRFADHVHPHLERLRRIEDVSSWMVTEVSSLSSQNPVAAGNLYRFMHAVMTTFVATRPSLAPQLGRLRQGRLGLLGNWKRTWMLLMFLRRDRSWVNCLLRRACRRMAGEDAMTLFHGSSFPEAESELPVDVRLETISREYFHWTGDLQKIARQAHAWVGRYLEGKPSSVLDALFFGLTE